MHEIGICPTEKKVFFGQLLGMSDPISFTLGKSFSTATNFKTTYNPLEFWVNFVVKFYLRYKPKAEDCYTAQPFLSMAKLMFNRDLIKNSKVYNGHEHDLKNIQYATQESCGN